MLVKMHYLNWDKGSEKGFRIFMDSMTGIQEIFEKDYYRTHEIELDMEESEIEDPASFLENIYASFNADNRSDRLVERSICAGDVIEYENKAFIVLGIGFSEIAL